MKWATAKIGEVCAVLSGATPRTGEPAFWDGDILWATPKDLSDLDRKYLNDTARKITTAGLKSCSASILPAQSVLFSSRAPIGLVAINVSPVCTNQGFKSMVPRNGAIISDYLFWWLKKNRESIEQKGRGATFKEVSKKIVEEIEIPLPPMEEQKRIAAILDAADALRAKRRESIAQLDALLQSTFLDMFGDPVTNPKGWETSTIKATRSLVQIGPFGSLLHKDDYVVGGVPLVNPKHIVEGKISIEDSETVSLEKATTLSLYRLQCGDIIMGRRGEMGRCALIDQETEGILCGTGSLFIRPNPQCILPLFLCKVLSSGSKKSELERLAWGVTMPNLNLEKIENLSIPLPPLSLQRRFASIVEAAERQKARLRAHLDELDALFSSLQSRAFNGEL